PYTRDVLMRSGGQNTRPWMEKALERGYHELQGDEPVTELARKWDGWRSQLKPSHEPIILARKPLDGTICDNVERGGTGALNREGCRIGESGAKNNGKGRFPANCVTTDADACYSKYFNVTLQELSKKASKSDRNSDWRGEEIHHNNHHPTVKPTDLMAWLVRLVTPPNGVVLDPFAGSGSTLVAAKRAGFGLIGIERDADYVATAKARIGEKEEIILAT